MLGFGSAVMPRPTIEMVSACESRSEQRWKATALPYPSRLDMLFDTWLWHEKHVKLLSAETVPPG